MITSLTAGDDFAADRCTRWLVRFLVASGVLFVAWQFLADLYLTSLTGTANLLFSWFDKPARFAVREEALVVSFGGLAASSVVLQLGRNQVFYLNLLVGIGLFAATPGQTIRWYAGWAAGVIALTWASHLASIWIGPDIVFNAFIQRLTEADRARVLGTDPAWPRVDVAWRVTLFEAWRHFGRTGLVLGTWGMAASRFLRLSS